VVRGFDGAGGITVNFCTIDFDENRALKEQFGGQGPPDRAVRGRLRIQQF
jgi:hypothetical protein